MVLSSFTLTTIPLEVLSFLVALGALIIAILSFLASRKTNRRFHEQQQESLELQRRVVALEFEKHDRERLAESKANVTAAIVYEERPGGARRPLLRIHNKGPATAFRIAVYLDGIPLADHPTTFNAVEPPDVLGPGAKKDYFLGITNDNPRPKIVFATWEDSSGETGSFGSEL